MLAKDRVFAIRAGTYTSSDIKEASFNYGYISGDTFKPGGTVAGSAKLTFTSIITTFNKLDKIYPEIGLLVGDSYEWVAMGEYFVNDISIDRNRNTTELDLMDGMFKLNQPYVSDLTYPAQIRDVIREICVKTGIELETDDLGFRAIQHHIQSKADKKDITFREVLSQAIQLLGFSAFFNRKGKLEIRGLIESNITITADNYFLHGLTKSELMYQIAGITCKKDKETLTVGLRTGRSLELENNFMIQNILDDLYYDLKNIRYYPYSLDWQGHLKLDVGQWVTLKTNKNETFKVPVLSQSFNFKGGLKSKIGADSKAGNDTQYAYKGFLGKRIKQMSTEIEAEVQQQLEYKDKEFDEKINKVKSEINDGIEQAQAEAERHADNIKRSIDTEIAQVNQSMQAQVQEHDRQVADILSKTQSVEALANQAKTDAASAIARANQVKTEAVADARAQVATVSQALNTAKSELQTAIANADQKARDSQASATALRNDLNLQANKILAQVQAQTALTNRVTTVETLADGTRSTVAELSKTVNKATGDITSVTNRTKVVEDGLVGVKNSYGTISQKVNTQTGQITSINQRTAQLESGLNGVKEKFENIKIGSRNYFSQYLANYDTSGIYAIRLVSETQPITVTVTDKDTSVNVSGCYFGLFKDKAAKQGAQWFLSNDTLYNAKKTISGWPILAVYPKNQATLDKIFSRYKVMVEIGNIATDWVPAEEDFRHELATYVRNAEEDSTELSRRIETADGKAVDAKAYAQQTAEGFKSRIESLETYKNAEGTRAEQYLSASRTETAKQLTAERAVIANNYLAKSVYDEDARGNTLKLNEIKTIADTAKQSLATYQNTVDRKLTELTSTTQTLDGKINTANTKVDTVAGQIRTELSKVEGKIPTIIGSRNYFSQYLANYDTSGTYATRLISETQPITITVTDNDPSVSVSGCYFGLFKDKAAEQGAQWFLSNGTLNNAKKTISGWPILAVYPKNQATLDKIFNRYKVMVEIGNIATDWVPAEEDLATVTALHNVSDTVDSHTRTIGAVGETGSILDNVSRVTQTANGLVQEVSGTNGLKTQVSQLNNSYAIKNLTSAGTVLNQINLLANGTNRIDGRLTHITGQTLIDNGVIKNAMIGELDAGKITSGTVDAARIKANSIDGSKIAFDEAFFNGLSANQAYLKKLFAKDAFLTAVQAVTLSASKISGGILTATNGAMKVNLNAGQILYYTDQAALKRVLNGYPTQFVKFATGTVTGKGNAGVTVIGSNRWNSESSNDGGFVGIRAWNGANIDQIDVVGDTVRLASSAFEAADGWNINTLPGKLDIDAFNADHRASSKIKVGDLWLWKNATTYSSMRDTINLIIDNLQLLHNNKSTERGYSYTLPAKV
ncbi:TPA: gp58-like family protein [Streptococcus suis]